MSDLAVKKHTREPMITIAKRDDLVWWKAWFIRIAAIILGFLLTGFVSVCLTKVSLSEVFQIMIRGVFGRLFEGGKATMLWRFLQETAILLCLTLAVTPAFKMKFWNCGAEGQALMGGLGAMMCMIELDGLAPWLHTIVVVVVGVAFGAIWGLIPALFKAWYDTNETLFTLMMNYVATQLVAYYVYIASKGLTVIRQVETGALPIIGNQKYLLNILIVTVLTVGLFFYLKYSKQGYEVAVVGESQNTARYIGINVKKVIIRTMLISGAIAGLAGVLLVAGTNHSINTNTVGGFGFTAIMVSWLGLFNPYIMAAMAGLVVFLNIGAAKVADTFFLNSSYADIVTGVVILFVVGCEFFIRYSVKLHRTKKVVRA